MALYLDHIAERDGELGLQRRKLWEGKLKARNVKPVERPRRGRQTGGHGFQDSKSHSKNRYTYVPFVSMWSSTFFAFAMDTKLFVASH